MGTEESFINSTSYRLRDDLHYSGKWSREGYLCWCKWKSVVSLSFCKVPCSASAVLNSNYFSLDSTRSWNPRTRSWITTLLTVDWLLKSWQTLGWIFVKCRLCCCRELSGRQSWSVTVWNLIWLDCVSSTIWWWTVRTRTNSTYHLIFFLTKMQIKISSHSFGLVPTQTWLPVQTRVEEHYQRKTRASHSRLCGRSRQRWRCQGCSQVGHSLHHEQSPGSSVSIYNQSSSTISFYSVRFLNSQMEFKFVPLFSRFSRMMLPSNRSLLLTIPIYSNF